MEIGDLDDDGDMDIVVANWGSYSIAIINDENNFSEKVVGYVSTMLFQLQLEISMGMDIKI